MNNTQHAPNREQITQSLLAARIVAIIRLKEQSQVGPVVRCLVQGGITALEVTSNTPGFCEEITQARKNYPDVFVGAGTVTSANLAQQAIDAGAQFLVTPNTSKDVVDIAHKNNIPVLMGALTPTEIVNAIEFGADVVKLFPAGNLGIGYFKGIQGPFKGTPFMAVGGINIDNIKEWFDAGAVGAGLGSNLAYAVHTQEEEQGLIQLAKDFLKATQ